MIRLWYFGAICIATAARVRAFENRSRRIRRLNTTEDLTGILGS